MTLPLYPQGRDPYQYLQLPLRVEPEVDPQQSPGLSNHSPANIDPQSGRPLDVLAASRAEDSTTVIAPPHEWLQLLLRNVSVKESRNPNHDTDVIMNTTLRDITDNVRKRFVFSKTYGVELGLDIVASINKQFGDKLSDSLGVFDILDMTPTQIQNFLDGAGGSITKVTLDR